MWVFSRLTRAALDAMEGQVDLVFNTPNGKSGPGYLKLGWREARRLALACRVPRTLRRGGGGRGRVPVAVRVRRPLRLLPSRRARPGGPAPAPPVAAGPAAA